MVCLIGPYAISGLVMVLQEAMPEKVAIRQNPSQELARRLNRQQLGVSPAVVDHQ